MVSEFQATTFFCLLVEWFSDACLVKVHSSMKYHKQEAAKKKHFRLGSRNGEIKEKKEEEKNLFPFNFGLINPSDKREMSRSVLGRKRCNYN